MKDFFRASEFQRYALCPASWSICKNISQREENQDAAKGKIIHALVQRAFALGKHDIDNNDAQNMLNNLLLEDMPYDEVRCECHFEENWLDTIISGHMDILAIDNSNNVATIVDLKTGWGDQVPAETNAQLRIYAWLFLMCEEKFNSVTCTLITPKITTRVLFTRDMMPDISKDVTEIVMRCRCKEPVCNPGAIQCQWCPASGTKHCEASVGLIKKFSDDTRLDIARLPELLDLALAAKKVIDNLLSDAKKLLKEQPDAIPGFKLHPGRIDRSVNILAANNLLPQDISEQLLNDIDISLSKCIDAAIKKRKIKKDEAKALVLECLEGSIVEKQCDDMLKQEK